MKTRWRARIEEAIDFDLQFRIKQINNPELLDIVRESAISEFLEEQKLIKKL